LKCNILPTPNKFHVRISRFMWYVTTSHKKVDSNIVVFWHLGAVTDSITETSNTEQSLAGKFNHDLYVFYSEFYNYTLFSFWCFWYWISNCP
jgi:hypothetical protein